MGCELETRTEKTMNDLEVALNNELTNVLGAKYNWLGVIAGTVGRRASSFAAHKNGLLEDVVTDVTGDINIQARDGTLSKAVIRAKEASKTEAELVDNLRIVVMKAAYFRASDAMKWRYRSLTQFSQVAGETRYDNFSELIPARSEAESEFGTPDYVKLLIDELELMALAEEWGGKGQFKHNAKRLRFAKEIVRDRVGGMSIRPLCKKYGLKRGSTAAAILHDIEQALVRVARKSKDSTLIRGTRGMVEV